MNGLGDLSNYIDENWHGGQIDGDFFDHPEMDIEENSQVKEKSNKMVWNWKHAMTRELMRGKHKHEILSKYKTVIDRFGIKKEICDFLDENDGVIGYFIVDVSNFDDKFSYEDMPQELKDCNLYAINAIELREIINRSLISENDGTLDGFLNSNENVDEEIYYIDECTGLPCIEGWNGESDDEDERLISIANLFLGKKWMSLSEKEKFINMEGKLPFLVSIVKRNLLPKFNSDNKVQNDVNDYDVQNYDLEADSQQALKDAEVNNIHERKLDDIGNTAMPEKLNVENNLKKSDYCDDVNYNKKFKSFNVKNELKESDFKDDIIFNKKNNSEDIDNNKEMELNEIEISIFNQEEIDNNKEMEMNVIETDIPDYGFFSDNMTELTDKDYKDDFSFDNIQDFVIDDIDEMSEDEFDYADLSDGNVDIDEMFDDESDKNEIEIEEAKKDFEISNKYDWSW